MTATGGIFAAAEGDIDLGSFTFASGDRADHLRLHYRTLGQPAPRGAQAASSAILLLHGTTGDSTQFLSPAFARHMFAPGQPLDVSRHYVVIPDAIGHGGSAKPSDGLRARFPRYGYHDLIAGHTAVLAHLGIDHLNAVLGTSMGGMQTWLWAAAPPVTADAYIAVACEPAPVTGRNLLWRQLICAGIRNDPSWRNGGYSAPPPGYQAVWPVFALMTGSPAVFGHLTDPSAVISQLHDITTGAPDATDMLYALEASRDYDPRPGLAAITAPLLAVSFDTDELNPPATSTLPDVVGHLPRAAHLKLSAAQAPDGHRSLRHAELYADPVAAFLAHPPRPDRTGACRPATSETP